MSLHGPFITYVTFWLTLLYTQKKCSWGYFILHIIYTNIVIQKFGIVPFFGVGWFDTYVPKSIGLGLSS